MRQRTLGKQLNPSAGTVVEEPTALPGDQAFIAKMHVYNSREGTRSQGPSAVRLLARHSP
jgi:hypothetical protein